MDDWKIGRFEGSRHYRYWVGGCRCGSGKPGREFYDARGIYCGITCDACRKDDQSRWAPGVMTDPTYSSDEAVDEG